MVDAMTYLSAAHAGRTRGRNLREIDFEGAGSLRIGKFPAVDFFGDGSFYLLDSPGHAIG